MLDNISRNISKLGAAERTLFFWDQAEEHPADLVLGSTAQSRLSSRRWQLEGA
jgi:hypothetical protein